MVPTWKPRSEGDTRLRPRLPCPLLLQGGEAQRRRGTEAEPDHKEGHSLNPILWESRAVFGKPCYVLQGLTWGPIPSPPLTCSVTLSQMLAISEPRPPHGKWGRNGSCVLSRASVFPVCLGTLVYPTQHLRPVVTVPRWNIHPLCPQSTDQ